MTGKRGITDLDNTIRPYEPTSIALPVRMSLTISCDPERGFRMYRQTFLTLAVVCLLVMAGCAGLGEPDTDVNDVDDAVDGVDATDDVDVDEPTETGLEDELERLSRQDRQIIHTGHLELEVDDVEAAMDAVRTDVEAKDGYVESSDRQISGANDESRETARLVVRVPSDEFEATMTSIEALGEVQRVETETEDVTDQLVDIDARLSNLETQRDQLRELMEASNDTRDVLAVQEELAAVQEQIERLEAHQLQLQERVALSTITVALEEPEPVDPATPEQWWEMDVVTAFLSSVQGVGTALRAMVVGAALLTPYLLVFGPLVVGIGLVIRWGMN